MGYSKNNYWHRAGLVLPLGSMSQMGLSSSMWASVAGVGTDIFSAGLGQSSCSPESLELGKPLKHLTVCFGTKEGNKGKEEEEGHGLSGWTGLCWAHLHTRLGRMSRVSSHPLVLPEWATQSQVHLLFPGLTWAQGLNCTSVKVTMSSWRTSQVIPLCT